MLIAIYSGSDPNNALPKGNMHFEQPPHPGEQISIGGEMLRVTGIWHMPAAQYAGPKIGILVDALLKAA